MLLLLNPISPASGLSSCIVVKVTNWGKVDFTTFSSRVMMLITMDLCFSVKPKTRVYVEGIFKR